MSDHHEIERAYALGPDDVLPDLSRVPGVARVGDPVEALLVATYVDTDDLALLHAGVTLCRRTGGSDAGWHLKVPAGGGRDEVHRPLGRAGVVPETLSGLVLGWTRGRALGPVATIETRRTTRLLHDDTGGVLAEVADDVVLGTPEDGAPATAWREVEVELVSADVGFLDDTDALLSEHGIAASSEQRKIGTVLAHRGRSTDPLPRMKAGKPAGRVLHHRVTGLVAELLRRDGDVRRGVDDGVHRLRVTCRRLRGALATYRPLVDREITDPLREELRWVARTLGEGRDVEVLHERLRGLVAAQPRALVIGPVRRRIDRTYAERLRSAGGRRETLLDSRRYLRLLDRLEELAAEPPWTEAAELPAGEVLRARVHRDYKRLRGRVDLAVSLTSDNADERDQALHDVRRAAKRLRYACEALEPVWGKDARRLRQATQEITRVLGERQDVVVGLRDLRRLATAATAAGESSFTYGRLHALEEVRAEELAAEMVDGWHRASAPKRRAWLR